VSKYQRAKTYSAPFVEGLVFESSTFQEVAKKIAKRKDVVIDGLDLDKKHHAKSLVLNFALRHGMGQ